MNITSIAFAAETAQGVEQSAGLGALGLDLRALIFQLINFAVLLGILHFVAYKPIVKVLHDRRTRIEESLASAESIEREKAALQAAKKRALSEVQQEVATILDQGRQSAKKIMTEATAKAQAEHEQALVKTEHHLAEQVATAKKQLQKEVVGLVAAATEKIMDEKLDAAKDRTLIAKRVKELL